MNGRQKGAFVGGFDPTFGWRMTVMSFVIQRSCVRPAGQIYDRATSCRSSFLAGKDGCRQTHMNDVLNPDGTPKPSLRVVVLFRSGSGQFPIVAYLLPPPLEAGDTPGIPPSRRPNTLGWGDSRLRLETCLMPPGEGGWWSIPGPAVAVDRVENQPHVSDFWGQEPSLTIPVHVLDSVLVFAALTGGSGLGWRAKHRSLPPERVPLTHR